MDSDHADPLGTAPVPVDEELNVMENTNGQVRRRGPERILVAATLAAVAMLGCSDDNGGTLNPTAPSAVNAPPTASSASTASLVSAVATPTSAGAEAASSGDQITADSSMTSTRGLNAATTRTPLTANFVLVPSDHDGSPFAVQLHFSEPIDNKPRHVKQAFSVTGGTTGGSITKAKRLNPQWLSGKRVASQWELTVTPSGAGDVVLAVPGGRSCSAGSALCTPARQSLSHDLGATIRDGTASSHGSRPGQTSRPGRVRDLRAEYGSGPDYLIFFRIPVERVGALKYHILVGGCVPGARKITVRGWSRYFYTVVAAGSDVMTRAFGVEGVNRAGTGPCVEVETMAPEPDLVVRSPSVSASSLETGESFTLSVTVGNDGAGTAAWRPTLLYYRSDDGTISHADTEEGAERTDKQKEIGALFAGQTRSHSISLTAPSSAGTYYYGACVASDSFRAALESDTTNNCSGSVAVVVSN